MLEPAIRQIGGRYQLTDVIGRGGMGIVYRGFDVTMSRQVAIKMLHGSDAEDKDTVLARFHREVTSLAALQHKNIVTIYTFEQHEGAPYMVMEYLEGKSLQEIISSNEGIELTEKLNLILQVCDGLQYAHENGLIHRDIKPANILVLKNGTAKLIDFGIARAGLAETITQPGQVVGSLSYMSPEQISNHALDARTDVFSAGIVLFQLLTGELPFRGSDLSGTISKILNAPVPPLNTYIRDYPKELDSIVERALAKKADDRYQSAEEFGFEISQVLETLKRGLAGELIRRAKLSIDRQDWEGARQHLQEIRKLDRRNDVANEMFQTVSREIQRQQKAAQVAQLRSQAQFALSQARYEEALECLDQGLRLDPGDPESIALRDVVKQRAKRAQDLDDALRRSQAAFYAGDLAEAQAAIDLALALEHEHTEARALEHLIKRESAERSKRIQLQGFVDAARAEIGKKNFVEALQCIQKAQAIDPSDTSIQELLSWASRGYAQEKARKELEKNAHEIGQLLREDRYQEALSACDTLLIKYPDEVSLLKLRDLANRQHEIQSRRLAAEEIGNSARIHAGLGEHDRALALLESAVQKFPGDSNLETLLAITRAEVERKGLEDAERNEFLQRARAEKEPAESPAQEEAESLELLQSFRRKLSEKAPISSLSESAEDLAKLASTGRLGPKSSVQYAALLAEFEVRRTRHAQDLTELETLRSSISDCNVAAEIARATERSRSINDLYPREERFSVIYKEILQLAKAAKQKREAAATHVSSIVGSMQRTQELSQLLSMEKQVEEASKHCPDDAYVRSLVNQASARIEEVREHKRRVLAELAQIQETLAEARSAGQLRLLDEQAKVLAADAVDDLDVAAAVSRLEFTAHSKLQLIESTCSELKEIASRISNAQTLEEAESYRQDAEHIIPNGVTFEEVDDLLRKVQRLIVERKKEYARIERNLNLLIDGSMRATGGAELDLILARRRDLVKRYPAEVCFAQLQERLENSVSERRLHLAEMAASEQPSESSLEGLEEEAYFDGLESGSHIQAVTFPGAITGAVLQTPPGQRKASRVWILVAGGVITAGAAVLLVVARDTRIQVSPGVASIQVDGRSCEVPCRIRLMPGSHELVATQLGFEDLRQTITVPWIDRNLPPFTMQKLAEASSAVTNPAGVPGPEAVTNLPPITNPVDRSGDAKIIINSSLPGVSVFVDGSRAGTTGKDGVLDLATSPGPHQVRVEKTGFLQVPPKNVRVDKDKAATIFFNLTQMSPGQLATNGGGHNPSQPVTPASPSTNVSPQPAVDSFVVLKAPVGAEIHIDEQFSGHSTGEPSRIKAEPGQRTIEVFLAGYQPWKQVVSVDAGKQAELAVNLTPVPVASVPSNPRPGAAISDADVSQIQQLLTRYAGAVTNRDLKQLKAVWPDVPHKKLEEYKAFPKGASITLTLTRASLLEGSENAIVKCKQVSQFNGKPSEDNVTFYVGRLNSGWIINQIPPSN